MTHLFKTMATFALAAGINTGSVALQLRTGLLTRRFGSKAWYVHLALVTPAWVYFLHQLLGLGRYRGWALPQQLRPVGMLTLTLSLGLWLWAFVHLGPGRTANANIFGHGPTEPVEEGPFQLLQNPMYDSYFLAFVGLGLWKANAQYLLLALESYVLLNVLEAKVENQSLAGRR